MLAFGVRVRVRVEVRVMSSSRAWHSCPLPSNTTTLPVCALFAFVQHCRKGAKPQRCKDAEMQRCQGAKVQRRKDAKRAHPPNFGLPSKQRRPSMSSIPKPSIVFRVFF